MGLMKPKIAVVGCGAVGSYYGARLCQLGLEVHFLLRSDYEIVRQRGVRVESIQGDFQVQPLCARHPAEIGVSDLVLIALKTTANSHYASLLRPLVGPHTRLVTLQNGLGNEEQLASLFEAQPILGGLCFVCLNRVSPGVIRHLAHGQIVLGEYQRPAGAFAQELARILQQAGVPCRLTQDLDRAHWEKLIWNIPFNGLGVAAVAGYEAVLAGQLQAGAPSGKCLPTDALLGSRPWKALVIELMQEVIGAARKLGHHFEAQLIEDNLQRTATMGAYKASSLLDFERGGQIELESLFLIPQRLARQAGCNVPRLTNLCRLLEQLNPKALKT